MHQASPAIYLTRAPGVALRARRIARFLEGAAELRFLPAGLPPFPGIAGFAGWGRKGRSHAEARARALPYLALEDGFLRSAGLGAEGERSLSLIADPKGIYYDAGEPSALEEEIARAEPLAPVAWRAAQDLMEIMREANLGKFNAAPDIAPDHPLLAEPPVVVVDQIAGDKSITGGGADETTFAAMLKAALAENPGANVVARIHPYDGIKGRRGHLRPLAEAQGLPVLDADVSWMSIARRAKRVYVVTSHAGFEALIAGVPVTCFGVPYYAGWGLTDDRQPCPRRTARPSLEALVHAAYFRYARYLSPLNEKTCDALEIARLLAARRRRDQKFRGLTHVVGLQRWKRPAIRPFLEAPGARATFTLSPARALTRQRKQGGRIAIWSSREPTDFAERAQVQGAELLRVEDGFLRSVGLGSNLTLPHSLVFDAAGIYYACDGPSDLELLLETVRFGPRLLGEAESLREAIVAAGLSKYNVGETATSLPAAATGRRRVLVPGQVANDASILRGTAEIADNLALLKAARTAMPDAYLIYKPHPDVEAGNRPGALGEAETLAHADLIVRNISSSALLPLVDEVHTMTSLLGFEALLRGRKVVTYGGPFYAGWGLTEDRLRFPRRTRHLTLDELVAGTLLLYPFYVDRASGWPCTAHHVVARLATAGRQARPGDGLYLARLGRMTRGLFIRR